MGKAEYALELALNFKSNGSRRICAIFLIGMQFMIIATMSAKGYGIFLGMVAALISWFTPLLVLLLCLFLVPARKGVSGTLIK
jgi:Mn2+/Fe2+ NRAMP family transporter